MGLRVGKPRMEWGLFSTNSSRPKSRILFQAWGRKSRLCGESSPPRQRIHSTGCQSELASCRTQVWDTVTRPHPHRGTSHVDRRPVEIQTQRRLLLSTPSSPELISPQASKQLWEAGGCPEAGGRVSLLLGQASVRRGPGTTCLESRGSGYTLEKRQGTQRHFLPP